MESSYGIGVKNRYAIFIGDEQEDPLEIVSKTGDKPIKTDKTQDKRSVKALNDSKISSANHQNIIKDNKTPKDSLNKSKTTDNSQSLSKSKDITPKGDPNRPPRQKTDRNQRSRDQNQTGDRPNHMNDRPNRPPRPSNDQKDIDDLKNQRNREDRFGGNTEMRERRERSDSDRRGGRNGRGTGDRRRGSRFGDERRGKRDLDRHSGSDKAGVKAVDKREGGGAHNWGKINDFGAEGEIAADNQELADRSADETQLDVNDSNQENEANLSEEQKEVVEGPKEMTLEEYKQQLEEKRVQPKFNLRKPGEGEDNSQWKKTFVLKKKVEDEEEDVEYEEIEVEEERKGRHKQVLDIEINFRDEGRDFPRRGGDARRGGGGRERRDRGDRPERTERGDRPERTDRGEGRGGGGERGERRERGGDRGEGRGGDRGEGRGGDRGEGRGGERSERGAPRGARTDRPFGDRNRTRRPPKEQMAPKVDDWNDFPSLAAA